MSKKVIVGLSGGVDSSVAALLLKKQGYQVEGLFMKNWEEDDTETYCSASEDIKDVEAVCEKINIPFHTINFSAEYWDNVFEYFLKEYSAGRTPNPDILCNKEIKFKAFLDYAIHLGADFIATGHYARIKKNNNRYLLYKGLDNNKDQSYFLHAINPDVLSKTLFPVGEYTKPEIRKIAEQAGLITHDKKDSTGICFIGERKFKNFLQTYLPAKPGDMVTHDGIKMGTHDGLMYYTIGQRQGLKIGGTKTGSDAPWYVVNKDIKNNKLIIAQGTEHPLLYSSQCIFENLHWLAPEKTYPFICTAKTRYRQEDQVCEITKLENNQYQAKFDKPQRAITPGQSIVLYDGEICLGGGVIVG